MEEIKYTSVMKNKKMKTEIWNVYIKPGQADEELLQAYVSEVSNEMVSNKSS
jgi:hypothetical protein